MAACSSNSRAQRWNRSGSNVGKDARHACANRWRASGALDLSLLRRWLRPIDLSQGWETNFNRGRSGIADQSGESLSERRRILSVAHAFAARNENEISRAARETVDGSFARARYGNGGGASVGIAQAHVR